MEHYNFKIGFVVVDVVLGLFLFKRGGGQEYFLDAHYLSITFFYVNTNLKDNSSLNSAMIKRMNETEKKNDLKRRKKTWPSNNLTDKN